MKENSEWSNLERYKKLLEMRQLTIDLQNQRIRHLKRTIELLRAEIKEANSQIYGDVTKL